MKVKLGDVFTITSGGTPDKRKNEYYENGTIPWVKTGDLKEMYVPENIECITQIGLENSSAKLFPQNTVLVAMYGATIGACSILPYEASTNQACAAFLPNEKVLPSYLYYFLCGRKEQFVQDGVGGAQPNISAGYLKNVWFELNSVEEQREIVACLTKVTELISLRKQQLAKLDELVKSRFIELFGDPVQNSMGWETELLKNATSKIGSGATPKGGKESYQTEGITLIRSMNVHDGRFEYKDLAHITDEQAKQLENVTVEENDVFINITGASVARSCIVPKHILPARVNQHVAIIRCITSMLNPTFANQMFLNRSFKNQLLDIGESGGATRQAITKQQLESLLVIIPPMELQEQFATFVDQTDKSKLEIQKSLEKLETLKKALMQEYFG